MSETAASGGHGPIKPALFAAGLVCLVVLARVLGIGEHITGLRDTIAGLGPLGPLVFIFIYILGVVAFVPGSVITIMAGALFGSVVGVAVVSVGSTVGAGLCFLISRYLARDAVAGWLGKSERMVRLDELSGRHGAMVVALTRLVPIFPFNVLNYGFGLTRVGFWTYLFWSWLCMIPGTILYVVGADALAETLRSGQVPWGLAGVFVAAVALVTLVVRYAGRRLKETDSGSDRGQS